MEQTNMILFRKEQTKTLLHDLDIPVRRAGDKEFILDENLEIAKCEICEFELTVDKLGNIAKGSNLLFCDNPRCFASHLANQKI
ncbi:MAG: hypothetical protein KJ771_02480 [Nanoarchaeota archaeon]|nr:hypothetical protein [Nanoarchaeota archaeon]